MEAWGNNDAGQITVPPGAQTNVTAIAAGIHHSLALKGDGTVIAWGGNLAGEATVPAGARSNGFAISAGGLHSLVLKPIAIKPVITIARPKKSGKLPASKRIQIKGKATDNVALLRWQYKLNKQKWKNGGALAGASASWKKTVGRVKAGRNTLQVRAYDRAGLVSNTAKRNFRLKQPRIRNSGN